VGLGKGAAVNTYRQDLAVSQGINSDISLHVDAFLDAGCNIEVKTQINSDGELLPVVAVDERCKLYFVSPAEVERFRDLLTDYLLKVAAAEVTS
jgi:hypothetical protein